MFTLQDWLAYHPSRSQSTLTVYSSPSSSSLCARSTSAVCSPAWTRDNSCAVQKRPSSPTQRHLARLRTKVTKEMPCTSKNSPPAECPVVGGRSGLTKRWFLCLVHNVASSWSLSFSLEPRQPCNLRHRGVEGTRDHTRLNSTAKWVQLCITDWQEFLIHIINWNGSYHSLWIESLEPLVQVIIIFLVGLSFHVILPLFCLINVLYFKQYSWKNVYICWLFRTIYSWGFWRS